LHAFCNSSALSSYLKTREKYISSLRSIAKDNTETIQQPKQGHGASAEVWELVSKLQLEARA